MAGRRAEELKKVEDAWDVIWKVFLIAFAILKVFLIAFAVGVVIPNILHVASVALMLMIVLIGLILIAIHFFSCKLEIHAWPFPGGRCIDCGTHDWFFCDCSDCRDKREGEPW